MFAILGYLLLLFCLVEGVRSASGLICEERRDGTLGFLFLTDLTSLDVLLGKLSGAALNASYSLLSVLPVLGLVVLLGGVTGGELLRIGMALGSALGLSLACGIWASTRSSDGMASILRAFGLLLLVTVAPVASDLALLSAASIKALPGTSLAGLASPAISLALVKDATAGTAGARFWWSQLVQWTVTGAILVHAAWHLRRSWRRADAVQAVKPGKAARARAGSSPADVLGSALSRRLRLNRWAWVLVGLSVLSHVGAVASWFMDSGAAAAPLVFMQVPGALIAFTQSLLLISLAARFFGEARQNGELEILLTTGLPDRELVLLLWQRLRRVLILLILIEAAFDLAGTIVAVLRTTQATAAEHWPLQGLNFVATTAQSVAAWWATVWTAMWFGLATRKLHVAVGKTVGLVLVATSVVVGIGGSLLLMAITVGGRFTGGWPLWLHQIPSTALVCGVFVLWFRWARSRLFGRFRQAAAENAL